MDLQSYLWAIIALLLVLALIGAVAWIVRRLGVVPVAAMTKRGGRRLAITEIAAIDAKRRLVLVRRDQTEHLLLLGATNDAVVETGITPPPTDGAAPGNRS